MAKKKIIVISHNYEPSQAPSKPDDENRFYTYGFGGNMGINIAKYINDYDVEVWRLDGYTDRYYEKKYKDVLFRIFRSFHLANIFDFSFKFIRELRKEVKSSDPILIAVHTHYWLAYQVAFFFSKSKIITTHHGDWSPFYRFKRSKGLEKIKALVDMFIEKKVFKNIDCVLTCDLNQVPYLQKAYKDIKYILWTTGVNLENMKPISKTDARKMLRWDMKKKYILYVGKLYKYKQADVLINTWKEIKETRPEVELVIIGNAVNDKWEEFYDLAVESKAILLGRILNNELYKYYAASDVYVLYALREDFFGGTGLAPLESLACSTPVVTYGLRNYIGNNVSELGEVPDTIEKYKSAILKVLDNPGNYKNMRETIEKYYSIEAMYHRLKLVLDELTVPGSQN